MTNRRSAVCSDPLRDSVIARLLIEGRVLRPAPCSALPTSTTTTSTSGIVAAFVSSASGTLAGGCNGGSEQDGEAELLATCRRLTRRLPVDLSGKTTSDESLGAATVYCNPPHPPSLPARPSSDGDRRRHALITPTLAATDLHRLLRTPAPPAPPPSRTAADASAADVTSSWRCRLAARYITNDVVGDVTDMCHRRHRTHELTPDSANYTDTEKPDVNLLFPAVDSPADSVVCGRRDYHTSPSGSVEGCRESSASPGPEALRRLLLRPSTAVGAATIVTSSSSPHRASSSDCSAPTESSSMTSDASSLFPVPVLPATAIKKETIDTPTMSETATAAAGKFGVADQRQRDRTSSTPQPETDVRDAAIRAPIRKRRLMKSAEEMNGGSAAIELPGIDRRWTAALESTPAVAAAAACFVKYRSSSDVISGRQFEFDPASDASAATDNNSWRCSLDSAIVDYSSRTGNHYSAASDRTYRSGDSLLFDGLSAARCREDSGSSDRLDAFPEMSSFSSSQPCHDSANGSIVLTSQGHTTRRSQGDDADVIDSFSTAHAFHKRFRYDDQTTDLMTSSPPPEVAIDFRKTTPPSSAAADIAVQCELISCGHVISTGNENSFYLPAVVQRCACRHCGISFDDDVIHSIHMGCHSVRDSFLCNVCGVACGNKYGFNCHLVRGHRVNSSDVDQPTPN